MNTFLSVNSGQSLAQNESFENKQTMTTKELASVLGVTPRTIQQVVEKLGLAKSISQVKIRGQNSYSFNEAQATAIKLELQNHSKVAQNGFNTLTISNDLEMMVIQKRLSEYQDRRIAELTAENELMKPKAEVYDAICDSETLQDLQTVAVTLNLKNIFKVLCADNILEEKWTNDNQHYYKPLAAYSQYLVLKDGKPWTDEKGITHIRPRVFVTGKGLTWLTKKYSIEV